MSSKPTPIPSDAFERPSSPSPSVRSQSSQTSSSFSPFQPVVLPSTFNPRPIVYRPGGKPSLPTRMGGQPMHFGEKGKEEDDTWETASVSSWGGGEAAEEGRAFHPRLRDLRQPRPNVRRPESMDSEELKQEKETPRESTRSKEEGELERNTEVEAGESSVGGEGKERLNENPAEKDSSNVTSPTTKAVQDDALAVGETEKKTDKESMTPSNEAVDPQEDEE
ncbi:hypothetical protein JCM3765_004850 [Sporobolomyces pararoseus]